MGRLRKTLTASGLLLLLVTDFTHAQVPRAVTAQTLARQLAAAVAGRQIFQVTPATIVEQLRSIVELKADRPTAYLWQFTGANAGTGLRWARAEFQPGEPGRDEQWVLLQIRMGFTPIDGDYNALYKAFESEITKRLGKPRKITRGTDDQRIAWRVAKYWEVSIRDGIFESPVDKSRERLILVEIAVLQGEED
jgi:hypothetical protein